MKRFLCLLLCLLLAASCASANSWGARGWTINAFDGGPWVDYNVLTDSYSKSSDYAQVIATSRYHNELVCLRKAKKGCEVLSASTTALYQPGHEYAKKAKLERHSDGFTLSYPDGWYRFRWYETLGDYILESAHRQRGDYSVELQDNGQYLFDNGILQVLWDAYYLPLSQFNVTLFPAVEDVARLNHLYEVLGDGGALLSHPASEEMKAGKGSAPVYSAPTTDSWRASKGKASVSLKHPEDVLILGGEDGWTLIEYEVSMRTSRVGYVQEKYIPCPVESSFVRVPMDVVAPGDGTFLTDDPYVSQYAQIDVLSGATVTALCAADPYYAYVELESPRDGLARGFMPLKDLAPAAERPDGSLSGVMLQSMPGLWTIYAGGDMLPSTYTQFGADGFFACYDGGGDEGGAASVRGGYYTVEAYDPDSGVSWADPPYLLTMYFHSGDVRRRGLSIGTAEYDDVMLVGGQSIQLRNAPTLNLTNEEGGGGYVNVLPR